MVDFRPIAVVGVACRLPGANNPDRFWELLRAGRNSLGHPSPRRAAADPRIAGLTGGFLDEVDRFDAAFFGIAPREAAAMDPQQRLLLELAWEAAEDARIPATALRGSETGVFAGAIASDYAALTAEAGDAAVTRYTLTGLNHGVLANRLSHVLGLRGASLAVDSAQSSGLAAVHAACASIGSGESAAAFAGAVQLNLTAGGALAAERFGGVSPSGRATVLDASGDGYVRGEGGVVLLLESLERAVAEGHRVHAVIRSTALAHDGDATALTVPVREAQVAVIRRAHARGGVAPGQVRYVELHGTGTAVGDPVEAAALAEVFGGAGAPVAVGSVKANIGHLEGAAGLAGLLKVVLAVRNREIPATLGHLEPHPALDPRAVRVVTAAEELPESVLAGVSSFGMGGTNVHVVVESAPVAGRSAVRDGEFGAVGAGAGGTAETVAATPGTAGAVAVVTPFVVTAKSAAALPAQAERLAEFVAGASGTAVAPADPAAVASALVRDRAVLDARAVVLAADGAELHAGLTALAAGTGGPGVVTGTRVDGSVAVLFGGQGSQRAGAGAELYARFPVFRAAFDAAVALLDRELAAEHSIRAVAFGADGPIDATEYTQPVIFAVETALYRLLESWGIEVGAVAGHSIGGIVAAHVAGALSLADAARLVAARGRLMGSLPRGGAMIAVEGTEAEVRAVLVDGVSIAAVNGERAVVLSGAERGVAEVAARLAAGGSRTKRLAVSHAFHSAAMEPILGEFAEVVAGLGFRAPSGPVLVSDSTGSVLTDVSDPAYWVAHLRGTVRFADAVRTLRGLGAEVFVEVGASPVLTPQAEGLPVAVGTLRRGRDEVRTVLTAAATVFTHGHAVNWAAVVPPAEPVSLPTYAFQRERHWLDTAAPVAGSTSLSGPAAVAQRADVDAAGVARGTAAVVERADVDAAAAASGTAPVAERTAVDVTEAAPGTAAVVERAAGPASGTAVVPEVAVGASGTSSERAPVARTTADPATLVLATTAAVLGHPDPARIDPRRTYRELGLDSLGATELATALTRALGTRVDPTAVYDHPTPAALAAHLAGERRESAATMPADPSEPLAIVAVSGRYPGGLDTPEQLWDLLATAGEALTDFPGDRGWDRTDLYDPAGARPGSSYARRGGFLRAAGDFDAAFFGISPREATAMDPQQRLVLEATWELFERAGIVPATLAGTRTAVYLGATPQEYGPRLHRMPGAAEGLGLTGVSPSVLSGRVAYTFGLEGPALTVDTACSSSLVALHLAVRALRAGEADLAVAGGVTVMANPGMFTEFSRQRGLAADGRCKAFAAGADGTGWAEAVSLLLVERLADARRNGHEVLALVRGTAVNQDGASNGLTAPSGPAQQRVIRAALADAGLAAGEVDAVEAHGTGTALGDPIEAQALLATYGRERATPLWLGSVKSNIGHSQAAAGTVGVTKMVLALRHGVLPATLHVDAPSPHVDWESGAVRLLTEGRPWVQGERPRRAGISSFGISGTNAHVVIEEAPQVAEVGALRTPAEHTGDLGRRPGVGVAEEPGPVTSHLASADVRAAGSHRSASGTESADVSPRHPFVLSARSEAGLRGQAAKLAASTADPGAIASALVRERTVFDTRAVALDRTALATFAAGEPTPDVVTGTPVTGGLAVLFSGQGSQRAGAGRELYDHFPAFRTAFDAAAGALDAAGTLPHSIREVAFGPDGPIDDTEYTQPVIFAVETALFRLLESWGVRAEFVAGHSIGGVVAAHVAGVLTLPDAARLVTARGRLMGALPRGGAMVAVEATEGEVAAVARGEYSLAAVNGPRAVVVSGAEDAVLDLADALRAAGHRTKRLTVSHAFHSALMDPVLAEFERVVAGLTFHDADRAIVSDSTGALIDPAELADPGYWVRHLRGTVRFADAVRTAHTAGAGIFLEVGAEPVLTPQVLNTLDAAVATGTLRAGRDEVRSLLTAAATVFTAGQPVDWAAIVPPAPRITLPTYAFQRSRYWIEEPAETESAADRWFWERVRAGDSAALATTLGVGAEPLAGLLPALDTWRTRRAEAGALESWTYRVEWRDIPDPAAVPHGTWLLIAPADGAADSWSASLTAALTAHGVTVRTLRLEPGQVPEITGDPSRIVSLLPLSPHTALADSAALARAVPHPDALRVLTPDPVRTPEAAWHRAFLDVLALETGSAPAVLEIPDAPSTADRVVAALAMKEPGATRIDRIRRIVPVSPAAPPAPWRPTGTVLITGGTGALGAHVARRLHANGCTNLLLLSRRGPDALGAAELAAELGATVVACDIGDRGALAAVIAAIPPDRALTDVVHTAAVLDDALITGLDRERIDRVHRVKVTGALNLHELTRELPLHSFVLFSSITGTVPGPGQGNYAPGNAVLDALAEHRHALGLPATAIAWGHWDGDGIAGADAAEQLRRNGLRPMNPATALDAMERAVADGEPRVIVADIDWTATRARPGLLAELLPEPERTDTPDLAGLDPAEIRAHLRQLVRGEVAAALGHIGTAAIDDERGLRDQGFTSLTSVELRNRLGARTGLELPATLVFDHPTVAALTDLLTHRLAPPPPPLLDTVLADLERIAEVLAGSAIPDADRAVALDRLRRLTETGTGGSGRTAALASASDDDLIDFIGSELGIS
ncbi:SDR family NAD(P)-dependent oxidoreductase [Nocardia sp. NPDC050697]|uniref:type I polyketide synthase n=1 Tax=Nocardia sp. NPDC050697 TaxID=3155158 RepID=UPI0033F0B130